MKDASAVLQSPDKPPSTALRIYPMLKLNILFGWIPNCLLLHLRKGRSGGAMGHDVTG